MADPPKPLAKQFQEGLDRYTLASVKEDMRKVLTGYRGARHGIDLVLAECADCWQAVQQLEARCDALEQRGESDAAEIGRLRERIAGLEDSLEKAREAYKSLLQRIEKLERR